MTCVKMFGIALVVALTAGCNPTPEAGLWIDPGQAVLRAAAAPRTGVTGVFAMTVKATGRTDKLHLNSERDYRDPRNLSIAVMPAAAAELEAMFGASPEAAMQGKNILVAGTARRVRIDFIVDGKPTGKYYYQTHVRVTDASQIQIL